MHLNDTPEVVGESLLTLRRVKAAHHANDDGDTAVDEAPFGVFRQWERRFVLH
ncbi:hypothetical protein D3C71_2250650 [compost metagenome]